MKARILLALAAVIAIIGLAIAGVHARPANASPQPQTVEAESLLPPVTTTAPVQAQRECCGITWSGHQQLWFRGLRAGDSVELSVPVAADGQYDLSATLTQGPEYGYLRMSVDGVAIGQVFDSYHAGPAVRTGPVQFGSAALTAGTHRLTITVPGRNPASTGYFAGLDTLTLTPRGPHPDAALSTVAYDTTAETPSAGPRSVLYDTGDDWYYNDHTVVYDQATHKWHLFGISHSMPPDPEHERTFGHLVSDTLVPTPTSTWKPLPDALTAAPDETHIWAPHVIFANGRYYMFYSAGDGDPTTQRIRYATSPDLNTWTRRGTILIDGYAARDPMVVRDGSRWILYYTATTTPSGGNHIVAYRTSTDLVNWSARGVAFTHPAVGGAGGPTESPFVVFHNGWWYLFVCCDGPYDGTRVYRSHDPLHFEYVDLAGQIRAHAAEVVADTDGRSYLTHAGWGQHGIWLAPLNWTAGTVVRGQVISNDYYRAVVQQWPTTRIFSLDVDPAGHRNYRPALDSSFRSTAPYLAVGGWGPTDPAGPAAQIQVSADGTRLALLGMPMGDQPVTADWILTFGKATLRMDLSWNVAGRTRAPVYEVAMSVDSAFTTVGDPAAESRDGNAAALPAWTMGTGDQLSVVSAYRPGSAWRSDSHWFDPGSGVMTWQPLWRSNGATWPTGVYSGGTWLLGASGQRHDTAFADSLSAQVSAPNTADSRVPVGSRSSSQPLEDR
jgi:hypothetical protein